MFQQADVTATGCASPVAKVFKDYSDLNYILSHQIRKFHCMWPQLPNSTNGFDHCCVKEYLSFCLRLSPKDNVYHLVGLAA